MFKPNLPEHRRLLLFGMPLPNSEGFFIIIYSAEQRVPMFSFFTDAVYQKPAVSTNSSMDVFQQTYPYWAVKNFEVDPLFVDPDNGDYRIKRVVLALMPAAL